MFSKSRKKKISNIKGVARITRKKTRITPKNLTAIRTTTRPLRKPISVIPTKPIPGGNTIVLYLSAHGEEHHADYMPLKNCGKTFIQTLSFSGHIGTVGFNVGFNQMGRSNKPAYDSASLAVIVNNYLKSLSSSTNANGTINHSQINHSQTMNDVKTKIINITTTYGLLETFSSSLLHGNHTRAEPFQIIKSFINERTYYFEPNIHEDCDTCVEKGGVTCSTLPLLNRDCPFYGLSIIYAAGQPDSNFSFVGKTDRLNENKLNETSTLESDYQARQTYGNLNLNQDMQHYWRTRITNVVADQLEKNEILEVFDKLISDKEITLSGICKLFYFLGYENIFIYDPSCRSADEHWIPSVLGRNALSYEKITKEIKQIKNQNLSSAEMSKQIEEKLREVNRLRTKIRVNQHILNNPNSFTLKRFTKKLLKTQQSQPPVQPPSKSVFEKFLSYFSFFR